MRFVIREQDYEQLMAAGRLSYRTGALETWRLTAAVDGYMVMRVDLDRRDIGRASSMLAHLLLDPDGKLERLKLREYSLHGTINVDASPEDGLLGINRAFEDDVIHDELEMPPGFGLMMPGVVGEALLIRCFDHQGAASAVILDAEQRYAPSPVQFEVDALDEESFAVTGQMVAVRPYLIRQNDMSHKIWLDSFGLPVRIDDEEGLLAIEDRYVRHGQAFSERDLECVE